MEQAPRFQIREVAWMQYRAIRAAGSINMADRLGVQQLARMIEAHELADWIREHTPGDYGALLTTGPQQNELVLDEDERTEA